MLVFAVTTLYTDYNQPSIRIYVHDDTTVVVNNGTKPATNLLLTVPIPNNTSYKMFAPHVFSNENYTLTNSTPGFLRVFMHRFVQGSGMLKIDTLFSNVSLSKLASKKINDSVIYATYDQGSETNKSSYDYRFIPLIGLILLSIAVLIFAYIYWIKRRVRKRKKRKYTIIKDIISIREKLKDPQRNTTDTNLEIEYLYEKRVNPNIKDIFYENPPHRAIIEDLCNALNIRTKHIESKAIGDTIADDNKKCLSLIEAMLEKIDWAKYPANEFDD